MLNLANIPYRKIVILAKYNPPYFQKEQIIKITKTWILKISVTPSATAAKTARVIKESVISDMSMSPSAFNGADFGASHFKWPFLSFRAHPIFSRIRGNFVSPCKFEFGKFEIFTGRNGLMAENAKAYYNLHFLD